MKKVSAIRNFVIAGHSGSGKTSLCDLMLFKAGAVDRQGSVDKKTSYSDYTPDEQAKQRSIYATPLHCKWNDTNIFFIDTPGYGEFIGETTPAMQAADNALIVVDGVDGISIGTTRAFKLAKRQRLPRFVMINHLDDERADFEKILTELQGAYGKTVCVPLTIPIGTQGDLSKVVHVLRDTDIPDDVAEMVAKYKELLMDTIAESNEELMDKYLEGEILTDEEIAEGLHTAILAGDLIPVFAGSVEKDIGITELMNGTVNLFLDPVARKEIELANGEMKAISADGDGQAIVFKSVIDPFIGQLVFFKVIAGTVYADSEMINISNGTKERFGSILLMNGKEQDSAKELVPGCIGAMAKLKNSHIGDTLGGNAKIRELNRITFPNPVMSYAITSVKSGEEDKIASGLHKISESDPTVQVARHKETHEMIMSGMGDQHLNNVIKKLKAVYKVDVNITTPKIAYRETVTANGEAKYRHKKQTGGAGQFAEVQIKIEHNEGGYEFVNAVVGGNIPKNFIPAVEKGIVSAMIKGPLVGCVVEDLKVTVFDGKHHPVDSNEMAFKIASRMAFRDAMNQAKPIILEPIMAVKIMIPDQYMGDITGDLNHKRGRILGMGVEDGLQVVSAEVPQSEMAKYATELRSITHGRGSFEIDFARYEQVPSNIANEIIAKHQAEIDEE